MPSNDSASGKHWALLVEIPAWLSDDAEEALATEFFGESGDTASDFLQDYVLGLSSVVRIRVELCGGKEADVVESFGYVREVQLVEPSRGFGSETHLTDRQLDEESGTGARLLRERKGCEWCTDHKAAER